MGDFTITAVCAAPVTTEGVGGVANLAAHSRGTLLFRGFTIRTVLLYQLWLKWKKHSWQKMT